jgi:hypothetical protein
MFTKINNFGLIFSFDGEAMINHLSLGFSEKSEQVLDQFARYCQKTVLGDFSAKLRKRGYFQTEQLVTGV